MSFPPFSPDMDRRPLLVAAHQAACLVVGRIEKHLRERANNGVHFRSFLLPDPFAGHRFAKALVSGWVGGTANMAKCDEYEMNSGEKFYRTVLRAKIGEFSSHPSRDPKNQQWGGGVLVPCVSPEWGPVWVANSASGFPENGDETTGLLMPRFAGWDVDLQIVKVITEASGNVLARNLFRELMPESVGILGGMESPEAEAACLKLS